MENRIQTYQEFYQYYLLEHQHKVCRLLHVVGTLIIIGLLLIMLYFLDFSKFWLIPLIGYGFAWVGHFFFEKNKPATFKYPLWSLISDFKMTFDILEN